MIITRRFLRDQQATFMWWALGLVVTTGITTALYPSVRDQPGFEETVEGLPDFFLALAGISEDLSVISAIGYLQARLFALFTPFILVFFGITIGTRAIAGSEGEGSLELLLTNPVSRLAVLRERALAVVLMMVAMGIVAVLATLALSAPVGLLDDLSPWRVAEAVFSAFCLAVLFAAVAFAVGSALGRPAVARGVASVTAIGSFILHGIIEISSGLSVLRFVTPWHWYANRIILLDGLSLQGTVLPLVLGINIVVLGAIQFARRDLC